MATRTSSGSGVWSDSATWGGSAAPGVGDIAIISSGHTVTVDGSVDVGDDAGIAITVIGTLTVNNPLAVRSGTNAIAISQQQTGTVNISRVGANTGSLTFNPNNAVTPHWDTPNTGSGTPAITITGESGDLVPILTSLARSGNRCYFNFTAGANGPTINWDYVSFTDMGGTADATTTRWISYNYAAGNSVTINHTRCVTVGKLFFTGIGLNDVTFSLQNSDFRACRGSDWLEVRMDTAAVSGTRTIAGCTFYDTASTPIVMWTAGFTVSGNVIANAPLGFDIFDDNNLITGNAIFTDTAGGTEISAQGDNDTIIEENVFLPFKDNPHYVSVAGSAGTGADTIVRLNIVDGGNFSPITDDGDFVLFQSDVTVHRNILINKAGTLITAGQTTGSATCTRNTLSDAGKGATIGETNGTATQLVRFSSNLIQDMTSGLVQDTAFVEQTTPANIDYNGCFNMSTAGNLNIGANNGYLGATTFDVWRTGTYNSTDNYGSHDIYGDPEFVDDTRTAATYYDSIFGSGGANDTVRAEMLKLNGTALDGTDASFTSTMTVTLLKAYIRAGFTPQAAIYNGTGDPDDGASVDVGAVDVVLAATVVGVEWLPRFEQRERRRPVMVASGFVPPDRND